MAEAKKNDTNQNSEDENEKKDKNKKIETAVHECSLKTSKIEDDKQLGHSDSSNSITSIVFAQSPKVQLGSMASFKRETLKNTKSGHKYDVLAMDNEASKSMEDEER